MERRSVTLPRNGIQLQAELKSESIDDLLQHLLSSWFEAIGRPAEAQEKVLQDLLRAYSTTKLGKEHAISADLGLQEFRQNLPIFRYEELVPYFDLIEKGEFNAILADRPVGWVMTRGTTGQHKVIPVTQNHLDKILICGSRAVTNYVLRTHDYTLLEGKALNLNFPSVVYQRRLGDQLVSYGYSSGTYARLHPGFIGMELTPPQEDIDEQGADLTREGWERRFAVTYEASKGQNVRCAIGVAPVIRSFARYLKRRHGVFPKKLWNMHAIFCTSVRNIHWSYEPTLKAQYGAKSGVEIYSATEGVFAQQLNEYLYVVPNFDAYLFEVVSGGAVKLLHEMRRGEWGRLIVSSRLLPRYDIGDLVECTGKGYYRVIGRARTRTFLEQYLRRAITRWFT